MDVKTFVGGALVGGAVVGAACKYIMGSNMNEFSDLLVKASGVSADREESSAPVIDPEITHEQFIRNEQFFGEDGQALVRQSRVIVVGVGGVGSHCAVTLARSGVGNLRLVDFDRVTVSSLNRHASAVRSEVGIPKVASLKRFIGSFAPECVVDPVEALFNYESACDLISTYKPDWVVDAIDNLATKADLLAYCHENGIKVVCACGSAAKCDPTRIRISTVENSSEDPLARAIRQKLRINRGLSNTGIPVVYSVERTTRGLLPLKDFQAENPKEFQTLDKFRVRILPVIAPLPSIMGNAIASYLLCQIAQQPFTPLTTAPATSVTQRKKLWIFLRRNFSDSGPRIADSDDADLLLDIVFDVCAGRSVISGDAGNVVIVPWSSEALEISNLVLMTATEAKSHQSAPFPLTSRVEAALSSIKRQLRDNGLSV